MISSKPMFLQINKNEFINLAMIRFIKIKTLEGRPFIIYYPENQLTDDDYYVQEPKNNAEFKDIVHKLTL